MERFLAAFRAVPDLTLAILCVVVFGLGPGAGMIALALFYTGAVSKMFGDLMRTAPPGPIQALYDAQQMMFYRPMMAWLLVTVVLVGCTDVLSTWTRRYFGWTALPH